MKEFPDQQPINGVFFYNSHEEMAADRLRWTVAAVVERARQPTTADGGLLHWRVCQTTLRLFGPKTLEMRAAVGAGNRYIAPASDSPNAM